MTPRRSSTTIAHPHPHPARTLGRASNENAGRRSATSAPHRLTGTAGRARQANLARFGPSSNRSRRAATTTTRPTHASPMPAMLAVL